MPEDAREWREVLEYAFSITLAYVTGNVLASLVQRMLPRHGSMRPLRQIQ